MSSNLPDIIILKHQINVDNRGSFQKIFPGRSFDHQMSLKFKESAISINKNKGTIRGMHFKKYPSKEWKLITCIRGAIFDVTIDIRKKSKNYGKV